MSFDDQDRCSGDYPQILEIGKLRSMGYIPIDVKEQKLGKVGKGRLVEQRGHWLIFPCWRWRLATN